jgi:poly-gamma-glutamate capsule biosynthesis protein CapA/YwtB (metallophosphatase superfamily)
VAQGAGAVRGGGARRMVARGAGAVRGGGVHVPPWIRP